MNKLFALFIIISLHSCQFHSSKNNNLRIYKKGYIEELIINPDNINRFISVSDLFENIKYIPLETTDSILIGRITDFEVYKDNYFILDKSNISSVFVFDRDGKNLLHFNKYGAGPGEYLDPFDLSIDKNKNQIMLWCDKKRSIFIYDFEGNFIKSNRLGIYGNAVTILATGNYAAYANYRHNPQLINKSKYPNLFIVDGKGEEIEASAFFPYINKKNFWNTGRDFSCLNNDTISIIPDHTNTIYYIANDKIYPRFNIDFINLNLDENYWTRIIEMKPEVKYISQLSQDYCLIRKYLETPEYIFITYYYKDNNVCVLYSKKTKRLIQFIEMLGCIQSLLRPDDFVDNKFYMLIDPYILKKLSTENVYDKENVKTLLNTITDIDNPIIMEMTLKNF